MFILNILFTFKVSYLTSIPVRLMLHTSTILAEVLRDFRLFYPPHPLQSIVSLVKRIFLLCCISVFAFSCAKDDKPEALTLDLTTLTLHTNEQAVLSALDAKGEKISGQNVEWKSSEPETVSVWAGGSVEAKKIGTATISATYDNQTKTCEVRVEPNIHIAGF